VFGLHNLNSEREVKPPRYHTVPDHAAEQVGKAVLVGYKNLLDVRVGGNVGRAENSDNRRTLERQTRSIVASKGNSLRGSSRSEQSRAIDEKFTSTSKRG
jgi:hypothetical protein